MMTALEFSLNKKKKTRDPALLADLRSIGICMATGKRGDIHIHHIKSRGSGGGDDPWNVIPLSPEAHIEIHKIGNYDFFHKYPHLLEWLKEWKWTWYGKKLRRA